MKKVYFERKNQQMTKSMQKELNFEGILRVFSLVMEHISINSFHVSVDFLSLDNLCKQFGPRSEPTEHQIFFLKKLILNKSADGNKSMKNNPACISQALEGKPSNKLDGNSFQSNSLTILVLFLEIETFLLINKPKHLFVINWISIQIYL